MEKCNANYGEVKSILLIPTYAHLMSNKIRTYYLNKFYDKIGLGQDVSRQKSFYNKGFVFSEPKICYGEFCYRDGCSLCL